MLIETVEDLRIYLSKKKLSPEQLGKQVGISNMTLRRMLKLKPKTLIPARYFVTLNYHAARYSTTSENPAPFAHLLDELERSGNEAHETERLDKKIRAKLLGEPLLQLQGHIKFLVAAIKNIELSKKHRALAIGALIYFLNPFDLIPDATLGIGYLDDLAVMTMVITLIEGKSK